MSVCQTNSTTTTTKRSIYPFKRINSFFPSQGSIESYTNTVIIGAVGTAWKYFAKRLGESIVIANSSKNRLAIRCFPWCPEKEDGGLSFTKDFKERKSDSFPVGPKTGKATLSESSWPVIQTVKLLSDGIIYSPIVIGESQGRAK